MLALVSRRGATVVPGLDPAASDETDLFLMEPSLGDGARATWRCGSDVATMWSWRHKVVGSELAMGAGWFERPETTSHGINFPK
jgi:hypothetical protein